MRSSNKRSRHDTKKHVALADKLRRRLLELAPSCPARVASAIAVDLADLSYVATKHSEHLKSLLLPRGHFTKAGIGKLMAQIDVNLLWEANYHIKSLRRNLPLLVKRLGP